MRGEGGRGEEGKGEGGGRGKGRQGRREKKRWWKRDREGKCGGREDIRKGSEDDRVSYREGE